MRTSGADRNRFLEILFVAQEEHPGARIVIKTHPETAQGHRQGHFRTGDGGPNAEMLDRAVSPWALFKGAIAVYTVSSTMGFEAIFAGHKPRVFGQPFYEGWGADSGCNAPRASPADPNPRSDFCGGDAALPHLVQSLSRQTLQRRGSSHSAGGPNAGMARRSPRLDSQWHAPVEEASYRELF